jgi:putative restriction endonuclease
MRLFVAVTDWDWFQLHASKPNVEEVNFWRPSPDAPFRALQLGEPLMFKLHAPRNYIAGGGFFTKYVQLPLRMAWEAFGEGNGVRSLDEARVAIARYRREPIRAGEDPQIGCIILVEPFFFAEDLWIRLPPGFPLNTPWKSYWTDEPVGRDLWAEVAERLALVTAAKPNVGASDRSRRREPPIRRTRARAPPTRTGRVPRARDGRIRTSLCNHTRAHVAGA